VAYTLNVKDLPKNFYNGIPSNTLSSAVNLSHPHFSTFYSFPSVSTQYPHIDKGFSSANVSGANTNLKGCSMKIKFPRNYLSI